MIGRAQHVFEKRAQIIGCLVKGMSIRATVRITGSAKNTITKLVKGIDIDVKRRDPDPCDGRRRGRPRLDPSGDRGAAGLSKSYRSLMHPIFTRPSREQSARTLWIAGAIGVLGVVLLISASGWLSVLGAGLCAGPGGGALTGWWGKRRRSQSN